MTWVLRTGGKGVACGRWIGEDDESQGQLGR